MNEAPKVPGNNPLPQGTNPIGGATPQAGGGNPKSQAITQGINQGTQALDSITDKLAGDNGNSPQLGEQVVNKEPQIDENGNEVESQYKVGDKVAPGYEVGEDGKVKQSATSRFQSAVAGGAAAYFSGGNAEAAKAAKDVSNSKTGRRISDQLEKNAAVKKTAEAAEEAGVLDATEGVIDGVVAAKNMDVKSVAENAKKIKKGSKKLKKKVIKHVILGLIPILFPLIMGFMLLMVLAAAVGDENNTSSKQVYENTYNYEWTGEDNEGDDNENDGEEGDNGNGDIGTDVILLDIPYYNQGDYGSKKFGGNTIATSGCSVTSLAMVLQYLKGTTITPPNVVDKIAEVKGNYNYYYAGEAGQNWNIMTDVPSFYGVGARQISFDSVKTALSEGKPVIASMSCCTFTRHGHFIVIKGYDPVKGVYYVNDSNHSNYKSTPFAESVFKTEGKAFWSFG